MLNGCANSLRVEQPKTPLLFDTYDFTDPDNSEDGYRAFDYMGRTYIPYAELKNRITRGEVGDCIGFVVQDGEEHGEWVVRLKAFESEDVLMIYYPMGLMDPPHFYRAIDTKGKELALPAYMDTEGFGYDYWRETGKASRPF